MEREKSSSQGNGGRVRGHKCEVISSILQLHIKLSSNRNLIKAKELPRKWAKAPSVGPWQHHQGSSGARSFEVKYIVWLLRCMRWRKVMQLLSWNTWVAGNISQMTHLSPENFNKDSEREWYLYFSSGICTPSWWRGKIRTWAGVGYWVQQHRYFFAIHLKTQRLLADEAYLWRSPVHCNIVINVKWFTWT